MRIGNAGWAALAVVATTVGAYLLSLTQPAGTAALERLGLSGAWLFIAIAVVLAIIALVARRASQTAEVAVPPTTASRQREQRETLIQNVRAAIDSRMKGSLYEIAIKDFGLSRRPLRMTPWRLEPDREGPKSLLEAYRKASGPLLVLGEPGTGKSTLLMEFAGDYLTEVAENDLMAPIPVMLDLTSWAAEPKPLKQWLAEGLKANYGVDEPITARWLDNKLLLPLLDGLDEVADEERDNCVAAINNFQTAYPGLRFVVSCRVKEYEGLTCHLDHVDRDEAILVRTLDREEAEQYLLSDDHARREKFSGLLAALNQDEDLWDVLKTPFWIWIGVYAFLDTSAPLDPNKSARDQLMERYIVGRLRDPEKPAPPEAFRDEEKVRRWLSNLAESLTRRERTGFQLEELAPSWFPPDRQSSIGRTLEELAALVSGIGCGILWLLIIHLNGIWDDPAQFFNRRFLINYAWIPPAIGIPWWLVVGFLGRVPIPDQEFEVGVTITWRRLVNTIGAGIGVASPWVVLHVLNPQGLTARELGGQMAAMSFCACGAFWFSRSVELDKLGAADEFSLSFSTARRKVWLGVRVGAVSAFWLVYAWSAVHYWQDVEAERVGEDFWAVMLNYNSRLAGAAIGVGLLPGALVGLLGGLVGALAGEPAENDDIRRTVPGQGLFVSIRSALAASMPISAISVVLGLVAQAFDSSKAIKGGFIFLAVVAAFVAAATTLSRGGNFAIKQFVMSFLFWRDDFLPGRLYRFLRFAEQRVLIVRSGASFRFQHPLLMEYLSGPGRSF